MFDPYTSSGRAQTAVQQTIDEWKNAKEPGMRTYEQLITDKGEWMLIFMERLMIEGRSIEVDSDPYETSTITTFSANYEIEAEQEKLKAFLADFGDDTLYHPKLSDHFPITVGETVNNRAGTDIRVWIVIGHIIMISIAYMAYQNNKTDIEKAFLNKDIKFVIDSANVWKNDTLRSFNNLPTVNLDSQFAK